MGTEAPGSLLDRRVVIVSGKGGTGKTTVAAALAAEAARRGRCVLVVEVGGGEHVPPILAPGAAPVGYAGRELRPRLVCMSIDPFEAMAEYLGLQWGARPVIELGLRSKPLRQLLEGAPGWRELITLGKIWHLEQQKHTSGKPRYDNILVDAPATGHGLSLLDVPRVVHSAVHTGPLGRNAGMVEDLIRDPQRCVLVPVSLAEELPASETYEFVARVRQQIGVAVDRVVVNALASPPFPAGCDDLDDRLAQLPGELDLRRLPQPPVLAQCARHLISRYRLNCHYTRIIGESTGLPVLRLPLLPGGLDNPEGLSILGRALLADPTPVADEHGPSQSGPADGRSRRP